MHLNGVMSHMCTVTWMSYTCVGTFAFVSIDTHFRRLCVSLSLSLSLPSSLSCTCSHTPSLSISTSAVSYTYIHPYILSPCNRYTRRFGSILRSCFLFHSRCHSLAFSLARSISFSLALSRTLSLSLALSCSLLLSVALSRSLSLSLACPLSFFSPLCVFSSNFTM